MSGLGLTIAAVAALVWWPAMPLTGAVVAAGVVGFGVGTVFPIATVSIQNAVAAPSGRHRDRRDELLPGAGERAGGGGDGRDRARRPRRHARARRVGVELVAQAAGAAGIDVAEVFRWVFVAALAVSIIGFVAVLRLEERPLRGPAAGPLPLAPDAPPAPAE